MSDPQDEFSIPATPNMSQPDQSALRSDNRDTYDDQFSHQTSAYHHPSSPVVEVNLDAISANYQTIAQLAPNSSVAPVVKCNGYGLGATTIASHLITHENCDAFYVAHPREGVALRKGITSHCPGLTNNIDIFVLNGPDPASLGLFRDYQLTPVLNTIPQCELWASAFTNKQAVLHIDTGMNRLGIAFEQYDALDTVDNLNVCMLMSHLACAGDPNDPMNAHQRAKFLTAAAKFPGVKLSLAASGGAFMPSGYHYSQIRLGISLYGVTVAGHSDPRLKRVARLLAPIIQVRDIPKDTLVGYDLTWKAERNSRIATLAIGYGDGYPRQLSNTGHVVIDGVRCPVVGRVSMDLITVDITDVPYGVSTGDQAEIFGHALPIQELAENAGTIAYELLTNIGPRTERIYINKSSKAFPDQVATS